MDRYVTAQEAAKVMGVSPRTLEYLRSKGEGPPVTRIAPRVVRYSEAGVRASLERTELHGVQRDGSSEGTPASLVVVPSWPRRPPPRGGKP